MSPGSLPINGILFKKIRRAPTVISTIPKIMKTFPKYAVFMDLFLASVSFLFRIGVSAVIENIGDAAAEDVEWSIELAGGLIILPSGGIVEGIVEEIPAGEEVTISSGLCFGFAGILNPMEITVTASIPGDSEDETVEGRLILVLVQI